MAKVKQENPSGVLRVLLIDESRRRLAVLQQALRDAGHEVVALLDSSADLAHQVHRVEPDMILIDLESPDRDTLEHLHCVGKDRPKPVVMFAAHSDTETTHAAIRAGVSAYLVNEVNPARLKTIMEVAIARFREFQALRTELDETRNKLAERKVIEKAKGLLMERKKLSEDEAYKMLRRMAMNRNRRLIDVAQSLIDTVELLE